MEIGVDEFLDGHHRGTLDFDAVEVLLRHDEVVILLELVALDEIAPLQLLPGFAIHRYHADAVAGLRIDQVEADG
jgi:hypothetical protein